MNIIKPLQISFKHQILEQDKKFYFIASASIGVNYSNKAALLEIEYLKDTFECMGDHILPDTGMPKPQAEFLVSGKFFAKNSISVSASNVKVCFGEKEKELYVFGQRQWQRGVPSTPLSITELALDYTTAYGGNKFKKNPIGVGFKSEFLPQIENPKNLIASDTEQAEPAGFAPLDPVWSQRRRFQGTYGDDYLKEYFPGYPPDFDWRSFMMAPEDQWIKGYFRGNESFELHNMHPGKPLLKGRLPDFITRFFYEQQVNPESEKTFLELPLNLDTVWFFPEKELVQLIWRGGVEVYDDEAQCIKNILVAYENNSDERRTLDYYKEALYRRLNSDNTLLNNFNTADLIPDGHKPAMKLLQEMALEDEEDSAFKDNMDAKADSVNALVEKKLADAMGEMDKGLGASVDIPENEGLNKLKEMLDDSPEIKPDPDVEALKQKLECILPGITANDPKKIDLSNFSFDQIGEMLEAVEELVEKKSSHAMNEVSSAQKQLEEQLAENITTTDSVPDDQRKQFEDSINVLGKIGKEAAERPLLPRIDKQKFIGAMSSLESNLNETLQQVQNAKTTGVENEETADHERVIKDSLLGKQSELEEKFEKMELEFKEMYLMIAHHQGDGVSPHEDELNKLKDDFLKAYTNKQSLAGKDWACLDLSGHKLNGIDLHGAYLEQVDFSGANLEGANLEGAILARAVLTGTNLSGANLKGANIGAVKSHNANFRHCNLNSAKLSKGDFTGSDFSHADLTDIESMEVQFSHCDFSNAIMSEMKFIETTLIEATFNSAVLTGSSMINSQFIKCKFVGSEMPRCTWVESSIESTSFDGANMISNCWAATEPENIKLESLSFIGTCLDKANFQNMVLAKADFSKVKMENGNCNGANMAGANFSGACLRQCQFRNSELRGAIFKNADMMEASLAKAILINADITHANLFAVDFLRSTITNTDFSKSNLEQTLIENWRPN